MEDVDDITLCAGQYQEVNFATTNINLDSSTWTNTNPAIGLGASGKGNILFTATNTGTAPLIATITMTPKSDSGCTITSKVFTIIVNPLPKMNDVNDITLCAGQYQEVNFATTNINLDSSTWTNTNPVIGLGASGTGNISFTTTNTGTAPLIATITMIPKSDNGCTIASKVFTFTVNPLPEMNNVINTTLCTGMDQRVSFTGKNIYPDSSRWTNSNPAIGLSDSGIGSISFTTTNVETIPLQSTITMFPKSKNGCVGKEKMLDITVFPEIYIRAVANDSLFCRGGNIEFKVTNNNELENIQWSGPDSFSSFLPNPYISNVSPNHSGTYYVRAISQYNCDAVSDSIIISVLPDVLLDIEDTLFICNSEAVIYSRAINATQYSWNTREKTENIITSSPGKYWVTATNQRCSASDTTFVVETNIPKFEIDTIGALCQDGSMELYVDIERENISYNWTTGETADRITVYQSGVYGISVSLMGCTTLQNINVECPCDFWVPNVFTPNGDDLNDHFLPIPTSKLKTFAMFIYDRWGNLIFQTNTYSPWYGVHKGEYAISDVYSYVIHYSCANNSSDQIQKKQGRISLIR
jgi:gliding motility-associated-like protein